MLVAVSPVVEALTMLARVEKSVVTVPTVVEDVLRVDCPVTLSVVATVFTPKRFVDDAVVTKRLVPVAEVKKSVGAVTAVVEALPKNVCPVTVSPVEDAVARVV